MGRRTLPQLTPAITARVRMVHFLDVDFDRIDLSSVFKSCIAVSFHKGRRHGTTADAVPSKSQFRSGTEALS
jgi:hypothetical protein